MSIIQVTGFDPSMTNWGIALTDLDLDRGELSVPHLSLVSPTELNIKQVRQNSSDIHKATQLFKHANDIASKSIVTFAEVPVGSQNANGMKAYGMCVGIIGSMVSLGHTVIQVTAEEVKVALTGDKRATKRQMIDAAFELYPTANFRFKGSRLINDNEHLADAIGAIHAGVNTPEFKTILKMYRNKS